MQSTPEILSQFKDPGLAEKLVASIHSHKIETQVSLMEVCGTHTMSIARYGIRQLMTGFVKLKSGPGCPVCVTSNADIDKMIALAGLEDVIIATFGDMMRVPGSTQSLNDCKAKGSDVRVCYSPMDALSIATDNPDKSVIFLGVGFETTTPLVAMTLKRAKSLGLNNFYVYCAHKNMPNALEMIVADPDISIDGFLLPGHVSTIIGTSSYQFLAEKYGIPGIVTGFDPVDILKSVDDLLGLIEHGKAEIANDYSRVTSMEGNAVAQGVINEVFDVCDVSWRGLGIIPNSGFRIRPEYSEFDADKHFEITPEALKDHNSCRCGDVLRSTIEPSACKLFGTVCTPENPIGPCMVSSEGTCAAYFRYYR